MAGVVPKKPDETVWSKPLEQHNNKHEAIIWLPEGMYVPSTNYLYKPGIRARKYPYLYKHESVVEFQEKFIELANASPLSHIKGIEYSQLALEFIFLIRDRFWLRDVSNMLKAVEDALVEVMGIDDSRVMKLTARKEMQVEKKEGVNICIYGYFDK